MSKIDKLCSFKRIKMSYYYYIKEMLYIQTWRKTIILKCFLSVVLIFAAIALYIYSHVIVRTAHKHEEVQFKRYSTDLKYILFWGTPKEGIKFLPKQQEFINQKCSNVNCFLTYNKTFLNNDTRNFDAIVFDIRSLKSIKNKLPRNEHQKFIFKSLQADYIPVCSVKYDNFFNWTWTYKLDSDIPHPFFEIFDLKQALVGPRVNMSWIQKMQHNPKLIDLRSKSKAVAWISYKSNCKNSNKFYLNDLKHELKGYNHTVDVYGPCGDKKCPRQKLSECYKLLRKRYYFSLILEDINAEDFVEQKLARAMQHYVIPIVMGGANYSRFLPPGSYLDGRTLDLKKIGAIINYLIQNKKMYSYLFDWHNHYYFKEKARNDVCGLCSKLNDQSAKQFSLYKHFRYWWKKDYDSNCHR